MKCTTPASITSYETLCRALSNLVSTFKKVCKRHIYSEDDEHPGDCGYCGAIEEVEGLLERAQKASLEICPTIETGTGGAQVCQGCASCIRVKSRIDSLRTIKEV